MADAEGPTQSIVDENGVPKLRLRKIRVEIVEGAGAGRVVDLAGPAARIGSDPRCDLVLDDATVSRHHATLRVDAEGLRVIDDDSRNGTTVDGLRVRDAWARPDSILSLGQSRLRLRLVDDYVELPLAKRERFGGLLGRSIPMRRLFAVLERIAPTDTTV